MEIDTGLSSDFPEIESIANEITVNTYLSTNETPSSTDFSERRGNRSMEKIIPGKISVNSDISRSTLLSNTSDYRLERIKFSTLVKLKEKDKKDVLQWFMEYGLISSSYICPLCDKPMKLKPATISDGYGWRCRKDNHSVKRTVRKGSVFSESKLSLTDILIYIHCWLYKIPHEWIYLEMECSTQTLAEWWDFCRIICVESCARDYRKIGGVDKIVEILGEKIKAQRRGTIGLKESWVFAGVEDMYGEKYFLKLSEKCNKNSFLEVIKNSVLPGTTIISEFCNTYNCFEDEDFLNLEINYSYKFETYYCSKQRKSYWSMIRKRLPYHITEEGFFDKHLAELMWRKNNSGADKMKKFLMAIKTIFPPCNKDD